jgi:autotransporter translocation and assembly factor TamB
VLRAQANMVTDLAPTRLAREPGRALLLDRPIRGDLQVRNLETTWPAALVRPLRLMRGRLTADLEVAGTLARPDLAGRAGLRQGRAVLTPRRAR